MLETGYISWKTKSKVTVSNTRERRKQLKLVKNEEEAREQNAGEDAHESR